MEAHRRPILYLCSGQHMHHARKDSQENQPRYDDMASSTTSGLHRARAAGAIEVSEVPWSALLAHETLVTFSTFVIIQADIHATKETTFDEKVRGLVHTLVAWLRGYVSTAIASEDCCVTSVAICRHK